MPGRAGQKERTHQSRDGTTCAQEHETHALPEILDLGVLECEVLELVLDALSLTRTNFDVFDLYSFLPERGEHAFLFARKEE
jgi:hypothetical protein